MTGFLIRWALAFVLLAATYNPTEWNYIKWTSANYKVEPAIAVLIGLILVTGYIIYLRATLRSIGIIGILLVAALVASSIWVMIDQGFVSLTSANVKIWVALAGLSLLLGVGISWSHVRRAITGQSDMDDLGD